MDFPDFSKIEERIIEWRNQVLGIQPNKSPYDSKIPLYTPFCLPIQYLSEDKKHNIPNNVLEDLELCPTTDCLSKKSMYYYLFQPNTKFGEQMIQEWKKQYTSDIGYLEDTQNVIRSMGCFSKTITNSQCDQYLQVWKRAKETKNFLEHYCYMDWDMLLYLNKSPLFLQILSMANLLSPLTSIVLPFLFLLLPFLILKIQRIPITFEMYIFILKDLAKNHIIGKTLLSLENISLDKIFYLIFSIGLYGLQVYQNISVCSRFYRNMHQINEDLIFLKSALGDSIYSMDLFVQLHKDKTCYQEFCCDIGKHVLVLKQFHTKISNLKPMQYTVSKFSEIGTILEFYYTLHCDPIIEESIRFSMGFEGYLDNLKGVHGHIIDKKIFNFACLTEDSVSSAVPDIIQDQVYPPLSETEEAISNTCKLDKNMLLTGPNASGKTTTLKTSLLNIIFTQQLGCGYYTKCNIRPYTHIHSYLNIPDTSERDSLFQAEARRCKEILDVISTAGAEARHFCIFDELYSGTNPVEASKAAHSFLVYISQYQNVQFLLTTHYVPICKRVKRDVQHRQKYRKVRNAKMEVLNMPDNTLKYTYRMIPGISRVQGAKKVLIALNYPQDMLTFFQ
jgi:MutS domain V